MWKPLKTAGSIRYECRHGLGYTKITGGEKNGVEVEVSTHRSRRERGGLAQVPCQQSGSKKDIQAVLLSGVLLLRGAQRHDQLPAHLLHRRGRDRGAPSTTRPSIASAAPTTRSSRCTAPPSTASTPAATPSCGMPPAASHEAEVPARAKATNSKSAFGWIPDRQPPVREPPARRPGASGRLSFVLRRTWIHGDLPSVKRPSSSTRQQGARRSSPTVLPAPARRRRVRALKADWADPLELPGRLPGRARQPHGSTSGIQYQCMATFNLCRSASHVRDRHRPRHGLPRLEPGSPGLRAPRPRARPPAHPRHRRHPARRRHLLPPVPAAHQDGNADIGGDFYDDHLWLILSTVPRTSRRTGDMGILEARCGYADKDASVKEDAAPPPGNAPSPTR